MKKFISKTAIIALPIFIILISVNYFGDAAHLFDTNYEKSIAKILTSGNYATNIANYDERLLQKELISNGSIKPKFVVLGSSRTMLLNSDLLSEKSFFNSSVSGASIEDIIGIYQIYKSSNKLPEKILIGIDPWTFNENNGQNRWESIAGYFYDFENIKNEKHTSLSKYKELFSFSYFQSSAKLLPSLLKGKTKPQSTKLKLNTTATKLADGSLVYDKVYREAPQKEVDSKIKSYMEGKLYGIGNFNSISERNWRLFQKLVHDMKANKIQIEFFLVPYAPAVYNKVVKEYPIVLRAEKLILEDAKKNNIKLYGSFNPYKLKMDSSYFYDGMHCRESGIKKILEVSNYQSNN